MPATKFIGNVLPHTGHCPEGDATFDFTTKESANLDLTGVPIRIEHADSLPIGRVTKHWTNPNGEKWIVGEIESDKGLASQYADHAIRQDSRGHVLYKGLSLQHVHKQWSDGTSLKHPVEVSICTEPRRPDCYIRAVSQTKKNEYIQHKASDKSKMSAPVSATEQTTPAQSAPVPAEVTNAVGAPAEALTQEEQEAQKLASDPEQLMQLYVDQATAHEKLQEEKAALQAQIDALNREKAKAQELEALQTKSKAENLSKALIESWQNTLDPGDLTDENKKAIFALAQNFPKESVQMMEIAHKASQRHKQSYQTLQQEQATSHKRNLESQVVNTILKRRKAQSEPVVTTQAASIKAKPAFNPFAPVDGVQKKPSGEFREKNQQLFSALKGMSSGNARSMMDNIAKYRNDNL